MTALDDDNPVFEVISDPEEIERAREAYERHHGPGSWPAPRERDEA